LASLERTTGKFVLFPTGQTGGIDLGIIDMSKVDYGTQREKTMLPIEGEVVMAEEEVISVSPVITLDGRQFHSPIKPLLLMGTRNADVVQSSATGATAIIIAKLGQTFDIGKRNVTAFVLTPTAGGAAYVEGVDYFLEANKGLVRFPVVAAGIADSVSVTGTFNVPALTRESYTAFNKLNLTGTAKYYEVDNKSSTVRNEWAIPGTFSMDAGGDADPAKKKKWTAKFSVNGQPTVLSRAA
jgi:hypothetical protein